MTRRVRWLFTLILISWGVSLSTWVVWRVFGSSPPEITAGTATAFTALFALPGLMVGLWKWRVERDHKK